MNVSSSSPANPGAPPLTTTPASATTTTSKSDGSAKKVRKPYTITKCRESWTEEEHDKFLEALQLFDRDWKKIEDFVGSKTVIQIRSHAQKYFLKVQKNGAITHVPPPRPKRKAAHPYPQKASKNVLGSLPAPMAYSSANALVPGYAPWDDTSVVMNSETSKIMSSQDEFPTLEGTEADIGSKGLARLSNSSVGALETAIRTPSTEMSKQGKQAPILHGLPDFAEVYSFIGSVFDPDTKGHVKKLKEMDPINYETVLLLMKNLSVNLSSPHFEQIRKFLSSNDFNARKVAA
ncbi:hypothetical protein K2173_019553 [Erythroxylum novogranatense]|uniref:Uncharacterized protein n=1 Tax=Erythroxylum novogranatense TaxID=1862640 RepID=A0AAV8UBJ1_9ROSI|nr:hypothetical protein K2173_019553 [Erythroxylum novogranatense]